MYAFITKKRETANFLRLDPVCQSHFRMGQPETASDKRVCLSQSIISACVCVHVCVCLAEGS